MKFEIAFNGLPPSELMPNRLRRLHWLQRARVEREARQDAQLITMEKLQRCHWEVPSKAVISFRFEVPDRRRRDTAELVSACKAWIDGIVDAGVLEDDNCWRLAIGGADVVLSDKPRTILEIVETERA